MEKEKQQNELKEIAQAIFDTTVRLYRYMEKSGENGSICEHLTNVAKNLEQCNSEMGKLVRSYGSPTAND